jgi:magnesium chelatase family protein
VTFPAAFQLVLAANPCPCGKGWGKGLDCTCSPMMRRTYFGKLSGPLLDRVDLQVHVQPPGLAIAGQSPGEPTATVAARVAVARAAQQARWCSEDQAGAGLNRAVPGSVLRAPRWRLATCDTRALDRALELGALSLRGYDRALRVAWTMADLEGVERPTRDHVELALSFRRQAGVAA